jgi:hypothetical protein
MGVEVGVGVRMQAMGKEVWKEREIGSRENGFGVSVDCRSIWQMSIVPRGVRRCILPYDPMRLEKARDRHKIRHASSLPMEEGRSGCWIGSVLRKRSNVQHRLLCPFPGPRTSYLRGLTAPDVVGDAVRACGPSLSPPQRTLAEREEEPRRWSLESPSALVNRRRRLDSIRRNP